MKMLIVETWGRVKVALLRDGLLVDYTEESIDRGQLRGNIYKGVVSRVEPSLQAAFIDIGEDRHAFIQTKDLHRRCFPDDAKRDESGFIQIQDVLKRRQSILVQVTRDPIRNKGADLTGRVSLAGRFLVLMPEEEGGGGISRRISNPRDRARIRSILSKLEQPKDSSIIARTVGKGSNKREFERDLARLQRLWQKIKSDYERSPAPGLLLREEDAAARALRDYLTPDIDEVVIGSRSVAERVREYVRAVMPRTRVKFTIHEGSSPLLVHAGVEEQVLRALEPRVPLPCGGSLVIQATEALVSVDVNSGKSTKGSGSAETALSTNLEAAEELARQLRLRDLGGLIVVDFIDMESENHRSEVENAFRAAVREDKARISVGHISSFGMLELSRQRLRKSLWSQKTTQCPTCQGKGRILDPVLSAEKAIDLLESSAVAGEETDLFIKVDRSTGMVLMNELRCALNDLERAYGVNIQLSIVSEEGVSPRMSRLSGQGMPVRPQRSLGGGETSDSDAEAPPVARSKRRRRKRRPSSDDAAVPRDESTAVSNGRADSTQSTEGGDSVAPKKRRRRRPRYSRTGQAKLWREDESRSAAPAPATAPKKEGRVSRVLKKLWPRDSKPKR